MKKIHVVICVIVCASLVFQGCGTMSNTAKGGLIGAGAGAAVGAGVGALAGDGKGAAIGAAVGAAVGAGAGVLIGKKMDKQKAELEVIEGAQVEDVVDTNGLQAIKVTFDSGILFETGKSTLSDASKDALKNFSISLNSTPDTDVTIYGHTDNTGSRALNEKLSQDRAESVANYLKLNGVTGRRLTTAGKAWDEPVGDNNTVGGRALNRRVEIYITANEKMINEAEAGKL